MGMFLVFAAVAICSVIAEGESYGSKPHILMLLADDFGWGNVGYHQMDNDTVSGKQANAEVNTPTLDALAKEGVILDRHYAYKICSPSRSSFQSGRLAVHVNIGNTGVTTHNPADPVSGYAGIPRNMTGLGTQLKQAGYRSTIVGKWDAGMATPEQTPSGRGYAEWMGYYQHGVLYFMCVYVSMFVSTRTHTFTHKHSHTTS